MRKLLAVLPIDGALALYAVVFVGPNVVGSRHSDQGRSSRAAADDVLHERASRGGTRKRSRSASDDGFGARVDGSAPA